MCPYQEPDPRPEQNLYQELGPFQEPGPHKDPFPQHFYIRHSCLTI